MSTLKYWLWLTTRKGLSARDAGIVVRHFQTPEAAYFAVEEQYRNIAHLRSWKPLLNKDISEPEAILETCRAKGYRIITMQDILITDYISIAGPGAAFVNAGIVTLISICLIRYSGDPYNGHTIVAIGLMSGFSLFGKNFLNIWPIILGTWLYARYQRESFGKYTCAFLQNTQ